MFEQKVIKIHNEASAILDGTYPNMDELPRCTITENDLARLHQEARKFALRLRFCYGGLISGEQPARDPRRELADWAEDTAAERLRGRGYFVVCTAHQERYDLLAQGVRIEVKASTWNGSAYQANMHGNRADVLVWCCLDGAAHWFVIPFEQVGFRRKLEIACHDPRDTLGQWRVYYDAWEIVDELVAAGVNAWQPALMGG